jgi:hypothetical protein
MFLLLFTRIILTHPLNEELSATSGKDEKLQCGPTDTWSSCRPVKEKEKGWSNRNDPMGR